MEEIRKVTAYETTDGSVFTDLNTAREHQKVLNFKDWYRSNMLLGNYAGSSVDVEDLIDFLRSYRAEILEFLKGSK